MATTIDNLQMGTVYGWSNIQCVLFGSSLVGFEGISWKRTQDKKHIHGTGREPVGVQYGNVEYTGEIEILYDEYVKIVDAAPNGIVEDIPRFNVYVFFNGTGVTPRKVVLGNVEFMESPFKSSQGEGSIKITLPILLSTVTYA